MLFEAVGQGQIFILLAFVGCAVALLEIAFARGVDRVKTQIKKRKIGENSDFFIKKDNFRQEKTTLDKKSQKNTKNNAKLQKNTEKNKKNTEKFVKLTKNSLLFFVSFGRVFVYAVAICKIVFLCDFGALRLYHILAFCVGFFGIKTIFAKRNIFPLQNDII